MKQLFPGFPDEARVWVYAFSRPLSAAERERVIREMGTFVPTWASHGAAVRGAFEIVEDRFLLVAGYTEGGMGGCSTDSMVRVMKELREVGIDGFDRAHVFFRDADARVRAVKREDFQTIVRDGQVDADTVVFDPTIQFIGDLRRGGFETTFGRSWHAATFSASRPR